MLTRPSVELRGQPRVDFSAEGFAVYRFALQAGLGGFHYGAHLFDAHWIARRITGCGDFG